MADLTGDELVQALTEALNKSQAKNSGTGQAGSPTSNKQPVQIKGAVDAFTNALNQGGGRVTDFSTGIEGLVPGIPILKQITQGAAGGIGYIENLQDTFNSLSKVGAGGAADLGELQSLAGQANLSLNSFANLVGSNTEALAGFAGGVDAGKRRFSELNKELYDTGLISQFKNLGYTSEEASEFVLQNTASLRRSARLQGLTDKETVAVSARLAKNLSVVAKLSGKDAKQMQDEMIAKGRDGATAGALRLMEMEGAANAGSNYKALVAVTSGLPKVAQDQIKDYIQLGAPLTDATSNFAAINKEGTAILGQIRQAMKAGASEEEITRLGKEFAAATTGFAGTVEGARISSMGQISDVGSVMADAFEGLQPQIDALDGVIEGNVTAMTTGREMADAYLQNLEKLEAAVTKQAEINKQGGPGQAAINFLNEGQITLAQTAGTINEDIGKNISSNSAIVSTLNTATKGMGGFSEAFETTYNSLKALVPGMSGEETLKYLQDNVGKTLENGQVITEDMVKQMKILNDSSSTGGEQLNAAEALKNAGLFDSSGNLKVAIMSVSDNVREGSASVDDTKEEAKSFLGKLFSFDKGTLGTTGNLFQDFGAGMPAMLHGLEAVIPKDSTQGNLLEAFPGGLDDITAQMKNIGNKFDPSAMKNLASDMAATGAPIGQAAQDLMANMSSPNTSTQGNTNEDLSETINQTLQQLVQINTRQLTEIQKQVKATKGMSGNVLSNVGL